MKRQPTIRDGLMLHGPSFCFFPELVRKMGVGVEIASHKNKGQYFAKKKNKEQEKNDEGLSLQ